ncbi:hypothetical protein SAMN05216296_1237 [Pseudomonas pohangensis]|uniref:Heme utilization protein n=1 Tax=Pseudomonas pohangensis TaxID=364197 RepID=A0A1H2F104_9PSED|nr:hypothetical protein [Pseudomonas pohangensis]SDU01037.1 hypothetical protein SAMN05216296_1237 [Pseudomonas pohangensis]
MKTKYLLTPLALALATVLSAGAYAEGRPGGNDNNDRNKTEAGAVLNDSQINGNNLVKNEGTKNTASVDGSLGGASGNVGVNVAAGDNNQQANAAAIAAADSAFIFATSDISQVGRNNALNNFSVPNNASLKNSANGSSGNVGINITAGNYNQQKNDMAIAYSGDANNALAVSNTSQQSHGNVTNNNATLDYGSVGVTLSGGFGGGYAGAGGGSYSGRAGGTTSGTADQIGNVYPDIWTGNSHQGGRADGHFDLDTQTQGGSDLNNDGGALAFNEEGTYSGSERGHLGFVEAGKIGLQGSVSGNVPVVAGFKQAVVNNASVTGSLNNVSGNVGVNVAAGGGNQQSNSLTMAVGCQVCGGEL